MAIMQFALGDLHAFLDAYPTILPDEDVYHYRLTVVDIPTSRIHSIKYKTAMDAIRAFTCLIWMDEPPAEWQPFREELYANLPEWAVP